jgi:hypothetical protein
VTEGLGNGHTLQYRIGGVPIVVRSRQCPLLPEEDPHYLPFLTPGSAVEGGRIVVDVAEGPVVPVAGERARLEAGDSWVLWERNGSFIVRDRETAPGAALGWELEILPGCASARMTSVPWRTAAATNPPGMPSPFHYPQDQILLMVALAGSGATVHAAGAAVRGRGIFLAGPSGAGKTTLSRLLAAEGHGVLSDDRVIVRREGGAFALHGTPWPGDGGYAAPGGLPLAAAVFLAKGDANRLRPLAPAELAQRLLPVMSVPWFDGALAGRYLELCADLAASCPAFELVFRPDRSAIEALEGVLART